MSNQPSPLAASLILDEQFLSVRSKLIDLAATFDRLDRAVADENGSSIGSDPRIEKIRQAVKRLLEAGPGRAEAIQLIFSLPYDE
ncbi:MAG: hypothetical protein U9N87_05140 [Planctomycetota bacterium]|nr:hypothetical protein [Planctomycetota bacterium]